MAGWGMGSRSVARRAAGPAGRAVGPTRHDGKGGPAAARDHAGTVRSMSMPGDLRPDGGVRRSTADLVVRPQPAPVRGPLPSIILAIGVALVAAVAWSILRGILELSVGLLVVSALGGWGIGATLRRSLPSM